MFHSDDQMPGPARGHIATILAQARASLKEPSRPYTPAESRQSRSLFTGNDYRPCSRPATGGADWGVMPEKAPMSSKLKLRMAQQHQPLGGIPLGGMESASRPPLQRRSTPESGSCLSRSGLSSTAPETVGLGRMLNHLDVEVAKHLALSGTRNQGDGEDLEECEGPESESDDSTRDMKRILLDVEQRCVPHNFQKFGDEMDAAGEDLPRVIVSISNVLQVPELGEGLHLMALRIILTLLHSSERVAREDVTKRLTNVWKTVFSMTKASSNDDAFFQLKVVGPMLALLEAQVVCSDFTDASVLLAGAVKNLSAGGEQAQQRIVSLGTIPILADILRTASQPQKSHARGSTQSSSHEKLMAQLLVQTTGILRNLSLSKNHFRQLAACGVPSGLCAIVKPFLRHKELMLNVARALAKLSLYEPLRCDMNSNVKHMEDLLRLMELTAGDLSGSLSVHHKPERQPSVSVESENTALQQPIQLLVRVAFTLGNLTSGNERNRLAIGVASNGGKSLMEVLSLFHGYYSLAERDHDIDTFRSSISMNDGGGHVGLLSDLEEILIKLIRLIANVSISYPIGRAMVIEPGVSDLVPLLQSAIYGAREELLLNVVSAITNLSYYGNQGQAYVSATTQEGSQEPGEDRRDGHTEDSRVFTAYREICAELLAVLVNDNYEAVAEAARAFGNLSRVPKVRRFMSESSADEALVMLLDHPSRDVIAAAAGTLVNIAADPACKDLLLNEELEGYSRLVCLLRSAGLRDPPLASVVCKALYNLLVNTPANTRSRRNTPPPPVYDPNSSLYSVTQRLRSSLDELMDAACQADESEKMYGDFVRAGRALLRLLSRSTLIPRTPRAVSAHEYEDLDK